MVFVLKKGAVKKEIESLEKMLFAEKPATGFNAEKYNGALQLTIDPMDVQKQLRNEWERDFS